MEVVNTTPLDLETIRRTIPPLGRAEGKDVSNGEYEEVWARRAHVVPVPEPEAVVLGIPAEHGDEGKDDEADDEDDLAGCEVEFGLGGGRGGSESVNRAYGG